MHSLFPLLDFWPSVSSRADRNSPAESHLTAMTDKRRLYLDTLNHNQQAIEPELICQAWVEAHFGNPSPNAPLTRGLFHHDSDVLKRRYDHVDAQDGPEGEVQSPAKLMESTGYGTADNWPSGMPDKHGLSVTIGTTKQSVLPEVA